MLVKTVWFGTFLIDNDKVVENILFPQELQELVERLKKIGEGKILEEERELLKKITMVEDLKVSEARLLQLSEATATAETIEVLDYEFEPDPEDYDFEPALFHKAMLELAKIRSREAISSDKYIVQAVNSINELTKTANLLSERLHEWYGMHWPELTKLVKEQKYVELVSELGDRDSIASEALPTTAKGETSSARTVTINTEGTTLESVGAPLGSEDKKAIMILADSLNNLYITKSKLEDYIKSRMTEVAPNLAHIAGPITGAKLMASTGGLERLAKVPSSTVQLLGAEKALFRHLKEGSRPPKHGLIFQHPTIHNAPYWQRGKIARALAGKISIAVKTDFHSEKFIAEELEASLRKRLEEIKVKYPKAPLKKSTKKFKKRSNRR